MYYFIRILSKNFFLIGPICSAHLMFTIKVAYDHTRIASYRHWGARSAGPLRVRLLALDGRNAELAGGLSSNPILSGLRRTPLMGEIRLFRLD